jgi:hypothetical protein
MTYLNDFVAWCQDSVEDQHVAAEDLERFTKEVQWSMERQYNTHKEYSPLRVSSLGKPEVLQGLGMLGYHEAVIPRRLRLVFFWGDMYEAWLYTQLRAYGIEVVETQTTVDFHGVKGHTDFIVEYEGERYLLEVKTMSDRYFDCFTRVPNDDRGYITQLSIYQHCVDLPALWLCYNKASGAMAVVGLDRTMQSNALQRAERNIPLLRQTKTLEDVFKFFEPPSPVEEVYRRKATGNFLLPPTMRFNPFAEVFYELESAPNGYNKDTKYVVGYRSMEAAQQVLLGLQQHKAA